jgi:hypothetical protein
MESTTTVIWRYRICEISGITHVTTLASVPPVRFVHSRSFTNERPVHATCSEARIGRHSMSRVRVLQGSAVVADFQDRLQAAWCLSEGPCNAHLELLQAI